MKKVILIGLFLMFILMLWGVIHAITITIDGLIDELGQADVAVVLGNKVELNGEPSKRLRARLDRAAELYHEGYFKYVIVSGGVGREGFDEAKVMKNYLVRKGVLIDDVIEDNEGYNSMLTAINSKSIMEDFGFESVMVISQYFHISRTKLAFKKVGVEKVYSAHGRIFEIRDFYSIFREVIGYYKYLWIKV
ncbi:YdcF family protein [Alkaliphilus transvaalensis]|uniref:YdcF family protein n=1 Tax=Alkaliphilus transvaalensis TaxID=114628 RepID=UPI00047B3A78|nr:YdcF family protein [Alkaliphilus transvaalensis]